MSDKASLASQFDSEMGEIAPVLERARECAKLTKPWLLPEEGHTENDEFKNNYQSAGSNGLTIFTGKLLDLVFPVGRPFFKLDLASEIKYAGDDKSNHDRMQALFLRELTMMAMLESSNRDKTARRSRRASFRTRKYNALMQSVATGDVLEQFTDDYRLKVFRRDQWTCRRDSAGDVLHYILREKVDAMSVKTKSKNNEKVREEVELKDVSQDTPHDDRMVEMTTRCQYQHDSGKWLVEQEINGVVFNESVEPVSPFFSTPYELVSPEHHGRGLVETNLGDLSGLDNLERNLLDVMGIAAKAHPVIDDGSTVKERSLEKPSGTVLRAKVSGGKVQDVGMLTFDMAREYTVLEAGIGRKENNLGRAMLAETESMPEGERVTATQVMRIAREIDAATGGLSSSISDDQQIPLLLRLEYQMERDKIIKPLPKESYDVISITGINAMRRGEAAQSLLSLAQVASQLGPEAQRRIDGGALIEVLARYQNIHEPGVIKSSAQVQEEIAAEQEQAIQQQVAEKGVEVLGNAAEQQITAQQ